MGRLERVESFLNRRIRALGAIIAVCGFAIRIYYASKYYLNPDESMHYTLAAHPWRGLVGFYLNAARILHPPLLIALLQPVLLFGHSEVLLRLVPSICGALFPWFVMLWVQRVSGNCAALCAQLLLTFSPTLVSLGSEVRAYTLAFLFFALFLLFLEKSLDSGRLLPMIWASVFLYLAILSEYSVAWFMAAAGIYAILRLWKRAAPGRLFLVWVLGQLTALGLYWFLYRTQIAAFSREGLEANYTTWLQIGFQQPRESAFRFAAIGTLGQFRYMFQLPALVYAAAVAFLLGLFWLWRRKSPDHAILMILPFCIACLGALFHLFPYGPTRHTAILDIAIAATVGTAVSHFAKIRILPIVIAAPPCILIWLFLSAHSYGFQDPLAIARPNHQVQDMREATAFLRTNVQADDLILTDSGTGLMLGYYCGCPDFSFFDSNQQYRINQCGNLHFVIDSTFQFDGQAGLRQALAHVHAEFGPGRKVWIAAGGFNAGRAAVANSVSEARPFGKAIAIYQDSDLQPEVPAHP
jgi:Dolichyl-phosphate-mannose-protein mannosyltransferase